MMGVFPVIGLIFLYRRNRRAVLDPTEDVHGIRLNIPYSRIASVTKTDSFSFAWMIGITISSDPVASDSAAVTPPVENDGSSDGATLSEVLSQDSEAEPYVVQVGVIRKDEVWDDLMTYVEKAKAAAAADATEWAGSNVYIDFDPRADLEDEVADGSGLTGLQKSVSRALGLDPTKEFFSEWRCLRSTYDSEEHVLSRFGAHPSSSHHQQRLPRRKCGVHRILVTVYCLRSRCMLSYPYGARQGYQGTRTVQIFAGAYSRDRSARPT
jgi:hypothetical protein